MTGKYISENHLSQIENVCRKIYKQHLKNNCTLHTHTNFSKIVIQFQGLLDLRILINKHFAYERKRNVR